METREKSKKTPQEQSKQPGKESQMTPEPVYDYPEQKGSEKLLGKVAIVTGGDSGIGRAVAILFAKEGADIAISYLDEHEDAQKTRDIVEKYGRRCILIDGNVEMEDFCKSIAEKTIKAYGKIDILVNNSAVQFPKDKIEDISPDQLIKTFRTNIFSYFWVTQAVLKYMKSGGVIINSTSVTAYRGSKELIDYSSTKAAIVGFTRSLAQNLIEKGIRVNAVAPGPIWTPLIPGSFDQKKLKTFGESAPMKRSGEPAEVAPSYLFLAGRDSSYMSGQVLHPNGGEIING